MKTRLGFNPAAVFYAYFKLSMQFNNKVADVLNNSELKKDCSLKPWKRKIL